MSEEGQAKEGGRRASAAAHPEEVRRWAALVLPLVPRGTLNRIAGDCGVSPSSLKTYLKGEVTPDPWLIGPLSGRLGVSVVEQMLLLGWLTPSDLDFHGLRSELLTGDLDQEFRQVTRQLSQMADVVSSMSRPGFAVIRTILEPPIELGPLWRDRWQVRASNFPTGSRYPVSWGMIVECIRHRSAPLFEYDELIERLGIVPSFRRFLSGVGPENLFDLDLDPPAWRQIKSERLELLTLLSAEPRVAYGYWTGEQGLTWQGHADRNDRTVIGDFSHVYYPDEQMRSMSRSLHPQRFSTDARGGRHGRTNARSRPVESIVLIGFTFHSAHVIGRLIAEAAGWALRNTNQITIEEQSGASAVGWRDAGTRNNLRDVCVDLFDRAASGRLEQTIVSISAVDACVSDDLRARLSRHAKGLAHTEPFVVLVRPNSALGEAWEAEQYDSRWIGHASAAKHNLASSTLEASMEVSRALMARGDDNSFLVVDLEPSDIHHGNNSLMVDPLVSDLFVRAAWVIYRRLCGAATPRPGSVLATYEQDLASDETSAVSKSVVSVAVRRLAAERAKGGGDH